MGPAPRRLLVAGIALAGTVAAIAAAAIGPSTTVLYGHGTLLDRIAQWVTVPLGAGAIEGPDGSYSVVPSTTAWILAGVVFVAFLALAVVVRRLIGNGKTRSAAEVG